MKNGVLFGALVMASNPVSAQTAADIAASTNPVATSTSAPITKPKDTTQASLKDIPVAAFAQIPLISRAVISPNGEMIGGLLGVNGEQRIAAFPLRTQEGAKNVNLAVPDNVQIGSVTWINNDNLLVTASSLLPIEDQNWYISRAFNVNISTQKITKIFPESKGQSASDILWKPLDGSNEILLSAQDSIYSSDVDKFWPSVYKVDVTTGKRKKVVFGKAGVLEWSADAAGNIRSAVGYDDTTLSSKFLYRSGGDGTYK